MSDRSGVRIDIGDFEKRIAEIGKKVADDLALKGLWEAAAALKIDADEIPPKTPLLWGNLRGGGTRSVKANAKKGGKIETDWYPKIEREDRGKDCLSILVSYLAPYAARWHEAIDEVVHWSEDGVGPKYLEAKMARQDLLDKYYGLVAKRIREGAYD